MAQITAALVKELRERTGAGMMDCKKALTAVEGDMDKAIDFLREKGLAAAAKKAGRIAAEGVVGAYVSADGKTGAIVEVNCETDFVAKNDEFKELCQCLADFVAESNPADVDALLASTCPKCGKTIEDVIKEKIASIGEKITFRRFERFEGNVASYIHNGKIGVLLQTDAKDEVLMKDLCLHIASCAPEFLSPEDIPAEVREEEKRIEMGKEDLAKKPENIREKIVEGRLHKILAQKCLLEQGFVKDPSQTVAQLIEGKLNIVKFVRYTLGEGLEKRSENFADEVMSQIKG